MIRFISYLRVSTDKQGLRGLGIEAQREAVAKYLGQDASRKLCTEFVEVESGKKTNRPELLKALERCRLTGATLIVAKIDRLARNARFLLTLVDGLGDGGMVACDLPTLPPGPMGKFILTTMAAIAELEAGLISERTKAALAVIKASGKKLGGRRPNQPTDMRPDYKLATEARVKAADAFAKSVGPMILTMRQEGLSMAAIALRLMEDGIKTARGGDRWTPMAVLNVLRRL